MIIINVINTMVGIDVNIYRIVNMTVIVKMVSFKIKSSQGYRVTRYGIIAFGNSKIKNVICLQLTEMRLASAINKTEKTFSPQGCVELL